jgi:hypothetical protein
MVGTHWFRQRRMNEGAKCCHAHRAHRAHRARPATTRLVPAAALPQYHGESGNGRRKQMDDHAPRERNVAGGNFRPGSDVCSRFAVGFRRTAVATASPGAPNARNMHGANCQSCLDALVVEGRHRGCEPKKLILVEVVANPLWQRVSREQQLRQRHRQLLEL